MMKDTILHALAIIANIGMILFALFLFSQTYGYIEQLLVLILLVPPLLSLWVILRQGDGEERRLRKSLRKAQLRKELKSLEEFDVK